uniref:Uncharacterized protein n=1 Tax=Oryza barthii TaxID=65489 RepID=A0A0D3EQZ0_9ORYZ
MELTAGAMSLLLKKVCELLMAELNLDKKLTKSIGDLRTELTMMHGVVRWIGEVPPEQLDGQVRLWARQVREISYDMEDAVDAYLVRVADGEPEAAKQNRRLSESLKRAARLFTKGRALHQIAGAVEEAQGRGKSLSDLRQKYGGLKLHGAGEGCAAIDPRLTALYVEVAKLVGVDKARDELSELLLSSSGGSMQQQQQLRTVSVFGFGGLGKTTLARAVYESIREQFDCAAFVSVSRNPNITKIFRKLLFELDREQYSDINDLDRDDVQLIDELRSFLQSRRYTLLSFECVLYENNLSSRIITTTRKINVSKACCSSGDDKIYEMKRLSDDDSKKLLYTRIFTHENNCPHELKQVSTDILKKCDGVPLAIITIASLLAGNNNRPIKSKDQWHNLLNSIGRGLTVGEGVDDMQKILSFSYYDLPPHLKTCLLYLSIFPEDYEIERDRLIWRWIAEDFVQCENNWDNLFEVGESYFNELINRSMVEPVGIDFEGRAQACRVHDMMLDFILSLSKEENFITIIDDSEHRTSWQHKNDNKIRRLSIQNTCRMAEEATASSMSQVLRVLDLEGCDLSKFSNLNLRHVGKLSHLRYLGLRRTYIAELPKEIGNLKVLQTLDIRGAHGIRELPPAITGLRQLMCLRLDWDTRLPRNGGLATLTSLEEMTGLRVRRDSADGVVRELRCLKKLRVLRLQWGEMEHGAGRAVVGALGELQGIQSIEIYAYGGGGGGIGNVGDGWVPPAFQSLRLRATGRIDARPAVERFAVRAGAFPCAAACALLHFVTAPSMFPRGAMPRVRRLSFSLRAWDFAAGGDGGGGGGLRLGLRDLGMQNLPSLEDVRVEVWYKNTGDGGGSAVTRKVEEALRRVAAVHPNRPAINIRRRKMTTGSAQSDSSTLSI